MRSVSAQDFSQINNESKGCFTTRNQQNHRLCQSTAWARCKSVTFKSILFKDLLVGLVCIGPQKSTCSHLLSTTIWTLNIKLYFGAPSDYSDILLYCCS